MPKEQVTVFARMLLRGVSSLCPKKSDIVMLLESVSPLSQKQLSDGRVPIYDGCNEAYWPTPLAILAWGKVRRV